MLCEPDKAIWLVRAVQCRQKQYGHAKLRQLCFFEAPASKSITAMVKHYECKAHRERWSLSGVSPPSGMASDKTSKITHNGFLPRVDKFRTSSRISIETEGSIFEGSTPRKRNQAVCLLIFARPRHQSGGISLSYASRVGFWYA